jgi:peptide/nickel transport system substrate-binding protein
VPALARSWERVDELTLEVTLRDDVLFHDGTLMTAEDVVFTFQRTLEGDAQLGATNAFPIASIEAIDDHHVRFVTEGVDGAFELKLSAANASIVPAAYHQEVGLETFQTRPIGTGPFRMTEHVPDSHMRFEVHADYWGGRAAANRVVVRSIPEVSTRVAALLNNEVDLILDLPPDQVDVIERAGRFKIDSVSPLNVNILNINGFRAPTNDKRVRQAISLGINREAIVQQLLNGHGLWPRSIQSEYDLLYIERPYLPYDPDAARALLEETGYAGEEIQYAFDTPNYYPLQREWSEAIVGMWSEIGLNVTMHGVDVTERVNLDGDDPYHLITNSSDVVTDLVMTRSIGNPNGYFQTKMYPAGYWDELNAMIDEARAIVDSAERAQRYQEVLDVLDDEVMVIVQFTINRLAAMPEWIDWSGDPEWMVDLRPGKFNVV